MAIVAKAGAKATIIPRSTNHFDPSTFESQRQPFFVEATAEQVLDEIKPIEFPFLPGHRCIAYDTETFYTGVPANRMPAKVVRRLIKNGSKYIPNDFPFCMSFSDGKKSFAVYDTLENGFKEFKKMKLLLGDRGIDKIGHNLDFDLHMTANVGVDIKGELHDTLYISKLTRPDAFTHNLCDVADEVNSRECPTITMYEHMLDSYKAQYRITDYRQFPRMLMTQYTCADTWNALYVFKALYERLGETLPLYETERQMLLVAYWMERRGIMLDLAYEDKLIPELEEEANAAERAIYDTAGRRFNVNSSAQLYDVLKDLGYEDKVKFRKPTEAMLAKGITKGNPKLDKFEMERLENEGVPLIRDIQTYKNAEKLLNTFARKLYEMRDATGTVHCNINTIEAKTGRFSISSPSMQNMPRRKDSRVRSAFIAPAGYTLYDFDFKSQESIILVHYSKSQYLKDIIDHGGDIHTAVASTIYSIPYDEVSKELRNISKSVEFAIVYGAGASKVSAMTGLSVEESAVVMKKFLKNAPEVDIFINTANKVARERRTVRTIRKRPVCIEHGREYACVNYVIQGSAADSTKGRMVDIHKFLKANNLKTYIILQVHDSLLNCVADDEQEVIGWLRWLQTERDLFRVQVTVDVAKCTPTWRDKEDVDIEAVKPPEEMLERMRAYDIWNEGIL